MLRIAIAGATGRMGRLLIDGVDAASDLELVGALEHAASPALGTTVASGLRVTSDLRIALGSADVLIDFTRPDATLSHLEACRAQRVGLVIGTTGFDEAARATVAAAAEDIAVVFAPNMSIGVNVLFRLIEEASRSFGPDYDVEIVEAHHRHKIDAPSGTALRMGEIVAATRDVRLDDAALHGRTDRVGPRPRESIGFSAIRGGDIVGDHTVMFLGDGERIELTHRAGSRSGYVAGSLLAARFLAKRKSGLFDMQDVLGFRSAPG